MGFIVLLCFTEKLEVAWNGRLVSFISVVISLRSFVLW